MFFLYSSEFLQLTGTLYIFRKSKNRIFFYFGNFGDLSVNF